MSVLPLKVENVYKSFHAGLFSGRVEILHGITFSLNPGEIFGLLGRNGAGKTTTLKTIVGLLTPDSGTVSIFGMSPSSVQARRLLGFLPEHPYFYGYLTGREFLEMAAALHGMGSREASRRADELLETVNMTHAADKPLRKYSKGMLQRIGLAQAIVGAPQLIVLDEPLSGLDPVGRRELKEVVLSLKKQGRTVLFSSHILPDVEEMCDRVGIVEQGTLTLVESVDTLLERGTQRTEVELIGDCSKLINHFNKLSFVKRAGATVVTLPRDGDVQGLIAAAIKHGCHISGVKPYRKTLEELLLEAPSGVSEQEDASRKEDTQ